MNGSDNGETAPAVRMLLGSKDLGLLCGCEGPQGTDEQPALLLLPVGRGIFFFITTHLSLIKPRPQWSASTQRGTFL